MNGVTNADFSRKRGAGEKSKDANEQKSLGSKNDQFVCAHDDDMM